MTSISRRGLLKAGALGIAGSALFDAHSGDLTVYLRDRGGVSLWSTRLKAH
ncbi:hypothetical protein ACIA5D_36325 [Actinoplanes sp. NPDC051513]|uniref:hypothetical protein n=1 Tax=Actinoplanes sp. NPDC051513 TaxID=3363908 RepID=UPI00379E37C8